jgi:hypothetical protein
MLAYHAGAAVVLLFGAMSVLADNPISPGFPYGSQKVRGVNLGESLAGCKCYRAIERLYQVAGLSLRLVLFGAQR